MMDSERASSVEAVVGLSREETEGERRPRVKVGKLKRPSLRPDQAITHLGHQYRVVAMFCTIGAREWWVGLQSSDDPPVNLMASAKRTALVPHLEAGLTFFRSFGEHLKVVKYNELKNEYEKAKVARSAKKPHARSC